MASLTGERPCRQTSTSAGSAETEHIALTVCAARPPGPSVATTVTPVAAPPIARTKLSVTPGGSVTPDGGATALPVVDMSGSFLVEPEVFSASPLIVIAITRSVKHS